MRMSMWVQFLIVGATLAAGPQAGSGDKNRLATEAVVTAPVDQVWAAFTTKEGLESWNVAKAEIELKVGGKFRTHYDVKGVLGDAGTIEQTILSLDPKRMVSFHVVKPPQNFPFQEQIKQMWTVIYFEPAGKDQTRVTVVCLGFGADENSQKMRGFFEQGNDYTLKMLQKRFAAK